MKHVLPIIALLLILISAACADVVGPSPCTLGAAPAIEVNLACPSTVYMGNAITITANAYDLDACSTGNGPGVVDQVTKYTWYIDGVEYTAGRDSSQVTVSFATTGVRKIKVVADDLPLSPSCDDLPATAEAMVTVERMPEPPIQSVIAVSTAADGPWDSGCVDVAVNQPVYFSGSGSKDQDSTGSALVDDQIANYAFDFGDGTNANGASSSVQHSYSSGGTYSVSLVADDAASVYDDSPSKPSQATVRVFSAVPGAPTITKPQTGEQHLGLSIAIAWTGETHDQYQVKVGEVGNPNQPDDPGATALWDSGTVAGPGSEADCPLQWEEGKTYYAFVREHNILGWGAWSAAGHRFTVLDDSQHPVDESLEPHADQNGIPFSTNVPYTFTAVYSDHCGYANIKYADFIIDYGSLCRVRYDSSSQRCSIIDDDGVTWIGGAGYTPGSTGTLENSNFKVHLSDTTVTGSEQSLTVAWKVEFKSSFTGNKPVMLAVTNMRDMSDSNDPQTFGSIDIVPDSGPSSLITSPSSGSTSTTRTISIAGTASDAHGLKRVDVSTDNGQTWHQASGTTGWTYAWNDAADGRYTLKSRAVDVNDDVQTPGFSLSMSVAATPPSSVIVTPAVDDPDGQGTPEITGDYIAVRGTASVPVASITQVEASIDGGNSWVQANGGYTSSSIYSFSYVFELTQQMITAANGNFVIKTRAYDDLGRVENPPQSRNVHVTYVATGSPGQVSSPTSNNASQMESQKTYTIGYSTVNLCTMDVLTVLPITGWKSMGGLSVDFSLYHRNDRSARPTETGSRGKDKWMTSYDLRLKAYRTNAAVTSVSLYKPDGSIEEWRLDTATSAFSNITGEQDVLDQLANDGGFVVTLSNKMKVHYNQLMDTDLWAPSSIEQLSSVPQQSHQITLQYNTTKQLEWVKDPDGKRWLCIRWTKAGADGHDAFLGVYTSQYFNPQDQILPGSYPQLWWAGFDYYGRFCSLTSPYATENTPQAGRVCTYSAPNADTPLFPNACRTLPSFYNNEFVNAHDSISIAYDDNNRINRIDEWAENCDGSRKASGSGKHYCFTYGTNFTECGYFGGMYLGNIAATDAYGTTTIKSQGPVFADTHYDHDYGQWYLSKHCHVATDVTDSTGHTVSYLHVAWITDFIHGGLSSYSPNYCHDGPADYGRDRWTGFRIFDDWTTTPDRQVAREDYYWTSSSSRNYSDSPSLQNVWVPQGKLGRYIRSHGQRSDRIGSIDADKQFSYDSRGNLCEVLDAITEAKSTMTYTSDNLLETATEPTGKKTKCTYLPTCRFLSKVEVDPDSTQPLDITTAYNYDNYGNVANVIGPYYPTSAGTPPADAPIVTSEYDTISSGTYSLPVKVTDPDGHYTNYGYTSIGLKQYETAPRAQDSDPLAEAWWDYRKDGLPYYTYHTGATDSTTTYGAGGSILSTTDANGNTTAFDYNYSDKVWHESYYMDATQQVTAHNTYDNRGNLASVSVYPGAPRATLTGSDIKTIASYTYDCLNRLTRTTYPGSADYPNGTVVTQRYDVQGRVTETKTSARSSSGNEADDLAMPGKKVVDTYGQDPTSYLYGKLIRRQYVKQDGTVERGVNYDYYGGIAYNPWDPTHGRRWFGLLKSVTDSAYSNTSHAREYAYDAANRLIQEKRFDLENVLQYHYRADGKTTEVDVAPIAGGSTAIYVYMYSPGGKLMSVIDPCGQTTTFEYNDPRGRLTRKTFANGAWTAYRYQATGPSGNAADARDLVATVQNHSGTWDNTRSYSYDNVGNILGIQSTPDTIGFGYDRAYRLIHEQRTNSAYPYSYDYQYDVLGNRTQKAATAGAPLGTTDYVYSADNSLASESGPAGSVAYHYDAAGNLISKIGASGTTNYSYDVDNSLTGVTLPSGASSIFAYDVDGTRVRTTDSRGTLSQVYINGSLYLESSTAGQQNYYTPGIGQVVNNVSTMFLADAQGSTVGLSGSAGGVTAYEYDAWGNKLIGPAAWQTPFTYVGKEGYVSDPDTGLMKLGCRYYDPTIGRFITKDPKRDGLNWYAYCGDDPVNAADPTGEQFMEDGQALVDGDAMDGFSIGELWTDMGALSYSTARTEQDSPFSGNTPFLNGYGVSQYSTSLVENESYQYVGYTAPLCLQAPSLRGLENIETMHGLPKEHKAFFDAIALDIEDYTWSMYKDEHRLTAGCGLHTNSNPNGNWNADWTAFISKQGPPASWGEHLQAPTLKNLDHMIDHYGLIPDLNGIVRVPRHK